MTRIPLALRLKKQAHRDVARAQDIVVACLYDAFGEAVLHGGTAIWRCYGGNRFSEDVDAYISRDERRITLLFEKLAREGFAIDKRKVGDNSLYSTLELGRVVVRFEALFKSIDGVLKEYETADGNFITVYTLTPEEFVSEKVSAYLKRRKIRDIYDIFILLRHVRDKGRVSSDIKRLVSGAEKPLDEGELKVLVIEGLVPGFEKMMEYIKAW